MWTRGASLDEMDRARPDLLNAARFALYAERMMVLLEQAEEVQNTDLSNMDTKTKARIAPGKMQARTLIPAIRAVLFPED